MQRSCFARISRHMWQRRSSFLIKPFAIMGYTRRTVNRMFSIAPPTVQEEKESFEEKRRRQEQAIDTLAREKGASSPELLFLIGNSIIEITNAQLDQKYLTELQQYLEWSIKIFEENPAWGNDTEVVLLEKDELQELPISMPECIGLLATVKLKLNHISDAHALFNYALAKLREEPFLHLERLQRNRLILQTTFLHSLASTLNKQTEKECEMLINNILLQLCAPMLGESQSWVVKNMEAEESQTIISNQVFSIDLYNWTETVVAFRSILQVSFYMFRNGNMEIATRLLERARESVDMVVQHISNHGTKQYHTEIQSVWNGFQLQVKSYLTIVQAEKNCQNRSFTESMEQCEKSIESQLRGKIVSESTLFSTLQLLGKMRLLTNNLDGFARKLRSILTDRKIDKFAQLLLRLALCSTHLNSARTQTVTKSASINNALEELKRAREILLPLLASSSKNPEWDSRLKFVQIAFQVTFASYAALDSRYDEASSSLSQALDSTLALERTKYSVYSVESTPFTSSQLIILFSELILLPQGLDLIATAQLLELRNRDLATTLGIYDPYISILLARMELRKENSHDALKTITNAMGDVEGATPKHYILAAMGDLYGQIMAKQGAQIQKELNVWNATQEEARTVQDETMLREIKANIEAVELKLLEQKREVSLRVLNTKRDIQQSMPLIVFV